MGTAGLFDSKLKAAGILKGDGGFSRDRSLAAAKGVHAVGAKCFPANAAPTMLLQSFARARLKSAFDHLRRQEIVNPIANIVVRNQRAPLISRGLDERSTFGIRR